jgi:hypothetical protein
MGDQIAMRNIIIFIILIFIFFMAETSSREPSDDFESRMKNPSEVGLGKKLSDISSTKGVISGYVSGQGRVSSSNSEVSGKSGDIKITQMISKEDPVKITKRISSINNGGYLVGDTIRILVEVECAKDTLKNIYIREDIDSKLKLLNFSNYCYKICSLEDLIYHKDDTYFSCPLESCNFYVENPENISCIQHVVGNRIYNISRNNMIPINNYGRYRYEINLSGNISNNQEILHLFNDSKLDSSIIEINDSTVLTKRSDKIFLKTSDGLIYHLMKSNINNTTYISTLDNHIYIENISTLNNTGKLLYWYYVIPTEAGVYDIETNLYSKREMSGEQSDYHMKHELGLEVIEPEFKVEVSTQLKQVYKNEPITFIYYIKPLSYDIDTNYNNIKVEIDQEQQNYNIIGVLSKSVENYGISDEGRVNWTIQYIKTGIHDKPGIVVIDEIHNTSRHYTFSSTDINVDTPIGRHNLPLILSLVLAAIGAISIEITSRPSEIKRTSNFIRRLNSLLFIIMIFGLLVVNYILSLQLQAYIQHPYAYQTEYILFIFLLLAVFIAIFIVGSHKFIIELMNK